MAFPLQFLLETVLPQLLMGKDKKKHSKKDQTSEDVLDAVALSLKKFRKVTKEISKLSTGQKVVGSLALAAAGLVYLATRETDDVPNEHATPALLNDANAPAAPSRHHKAPKHQHFSEE
ncbi:hypothetical protein [Hymenobacter terrigena]